MDGIEKVAMSAFRKELAGFLRRARNGEQIIVTVDGKPCAQLGPLEPMQSVEIEHLIASGFLTEPASTVSGNSPSTMSFPVDVSLTDLLSEIRG